MDFDDMTDNTFTNTARLSTGSTISQHRLTADKGASSAVSPALITPTSPSSSISIPVDAPPSPVSSKSTPSRSTSNRRSNDTLNMSSAIDSSSSSSTPPLEPRSSHHPSPRKSSKMGSAAALQLGSSTFGYQEHQYYAAQRRRSSITSLSSSSSGDSSDSLCAITGPYQPTMALPSLLLTKIEAAPTTTDSEINVNRHSNNSTDSNKSNQNQHDSLNDLSTTSSVHGETLQQAGEGRFRTSSLPRKLQFTRSVFGSMDTTDHTMAAVEPDTSLGRVVQRQPSGLSLRKKYNRLSRSSMDGTSSNVSNSGGRKDKSGPTLSVLFGGDNAPSSNEGQGIEHVDLQHHSYYGSATTLESKDVGSSSRYSYQQQPETSSNSRYLDTYLKLIINLEHSMNCGGFVTPKLYIPRNLWYQNNIRLSSMDVKVAACESLISDLNRIEKWRNLDDILGSLRLIESLEEVVDGLQVTLSKKLKRDSLVDTNDDNNNGSLDNGTGHQYSSHGNNDHNSGNNNLNNNGGSINKRAQLLSWGSKLTKSVERMNNFSLTKVEDQYRHYIEVLQKLFIKLHLLEMWFQHYLKKDRLMNPHYDTLLAKLGKVCDGINRVVGGFVLRDLAILLGKWLKRGGICVNE
ncbi:hypothetical protein BC941DRAFT_204039 [Chlamydoabsidia padenii]|nr:hypothetical protein BC941DRAFT_204039 [Chlamydoabsidia padenii]